MMDYHAVSSRRGGFDVAVSVSELDRGYRDGVVEWAVSRGTGHWEERGRKGCGKVLGRLFDGRHDGQEDLLRTLMGNLSGLDVFRVHGSLLAIGEIVRTLTSSNIFRDPDLYNVRPSSWFHLIVDDSTLFGKVTCLHQKIGALKSHHARLSGLYKIYNPI